MHYSKDKAIRDYYKWSAGNAKKDFDSYGLRNTLEYGTRMFTGTGNTIGTLKKAFPTAPSPIKGFGR